MWAFYRFIRTSLAQNKPYDQFVRELLLSEGSGYRDGVANFYRAVPEREPKTWAETVATVFMGVRIDCAKCHSHPYEPWTQNDHHGLAAFFAKVGVKDTPEWGEQIVFSDPTASSATPARANLSSPNSSATPNRWSWMGQTHEWRSSSG
jgi:hypothetical protein